MRYLSNHKNILFGVAALIMIFLIMIIQNYYSINLKDLKKYIESLDVGLESNIQTSFTGSGKFIDNNSPEKLNEHKIENQINFLLKKKIDEELKYERELMSKTKKKFEERIKEIEQELNKSKDDSKKQLELVENNFANAQKELEAVKKGFTTVTIQKVNSNFPNYIKHVYSFETNDEEKTYDASKIDLVVLSSINAFVRDVTFQDFFKMIENIDYETSKTSISLLIGSKDLFNSIDNYISNMFKNIETIKDIKLLENVFPKITLINADFLESELQIDGIDRHNDEVQKKRRRVLSRMRNFLVNHGIENEIHTLFLDSDIIRLPHNLMSILINAKKDIATIRIEIIDSNDNTVYPDYDLNAWAGDRKKPTLEEEEKMDNDPNFYFVPRPGENTIHMQDLSFNHEKYGLTSDPNSAYELKSVGGGVLYVRADIYKQGAAFPPYYVIGTNWDREGWDGIETEGLCYIANIIGYKCWGFPNLIGVHSSL